MGAPARTTAALPCRAHRRHKAWPRQIGFAGGVAARVTWRLRRTPMTRPNTAPMIAPKKSDQTAVFFAASARIGLLNALSEAGKLVTFHASSRLAIVAVKRLLKVSSPPSVSVKRSFMLPHDTA